jgi:hypothetical protein
MPKIEEILHYEEEKSQGEVISVLLQDEQRLSLHPW